MINSMTAFARESLATDNAVLTLEVRSVNHRYLDCTFKLPDSLRPLEGRLRDLASSTVARGKLDCLVRVQAGSEEGGSLNVNHDRLQAVLQAVNQVSAKLPDAQAINPLELLQFPGICQGQEKPEEERPDKMTITTTISMMSMVVSLRVSRRP